MIQSVPDYTQLEQRLQYNFVDRATLQRALTHTSAVSPGRRVKHSYQRLEFLGDRVLGLVVADLLFQRMPDAKEGELARALNSVVRKETCAAVALDLGLGGEIHMDKSEERNGGRRKASVLADACEAVIGAIYVDGGFDPAYGFIQRSFSRHLNATSDLRSDAKTALQEWAQGKGLPVPQYVETGRAGPAHSPIFTISVKIEGFSDISANGPSKKTAEQSVAKKFLQREKLWKQTDE